MTLEEWGWVLETLRIAGIIAILGFWCAVSIFAIRILAY